MPDKIVSIVMMPRISVGLTRSPPIGWARQKRRASKIQPKPVGGGISAVVSDVDKCRPEADCDVISGVAINLVGLEVRVKCGGSRLNGAAELRWPAKILGKSVLKIYEPLTLCWTPTNDERQSTEVMA